MPLAVVRLAVAATLSLTPFQAVPHTDDTRELTRLEQVWNDAHLRGDVAALDRLLADGLVVTVPEMPVMTKADILGFWRSGRAKITRYETTETRVQVHSDTALVIGRLRRTRDFNGTVVDDDWRFTKTYVRRPGAWVVVAYHASTAAR